MFCSNTLITFYPASLGGHSNVNRHLVMSKKSIRTFGRCQKVLDIWSYMVLSKTSMETSSPQQKVIFGPVQNVQGDIRSVPKGP